MIPPIEVYRVGGLHFVSDGHHRVSIAAATGQQTIDADVTEILTAKPPNRTTRPQPADSPAKPRNGPSVPQPAGGPRDGLIEARGNRVHAPPAPWKTLHLTDQRAAGRIGHPGRDAALSSAGTGPRASRA